MPDYPVVEFTRKHLLVAKAGLKEATTKTELNNFGLVFQDFSKNIYYNQPCYGALAHPDNHSHHAANNPCVLFYDWQGKNRAVSDDLAKRYTHWLLTESIFRHAFVTKRAHLVLKGGAVYSTQYPIQYVIQAGKALRAMSEFPQIVEMWDKLSPHMNKNVALFLAHFIRKSARAHCDFEFWDGYIGGHQMFDTLHFGCRGLKRVSEEDFSAFTQPSMATQPWGYQGQGLIWGKVKPGEAYRAITLPPEAAKQVHRQDLFGQPIVINTYRWRDLPDTGHLFLKHNVEKLGDAA